MKYKFTGIGDFNDGMSDAEITDWIYREFQDPVNKLTPQMFEGVQFIYAYYAAHYEGSFACLYEQNGKFFEVHASHCSCYRLEGQWDPTEVTPAYLGNEDLQSTYGRPFYALDADDFKEKTKIREVLRFYFGPYSEED